MAMSQQVQTANQSASQTYPIDRAVGVFVGGTSGVGEHTAYKFAQFVNSPTVYILGRKEPAGNAVLAKLRQLNSSPEANYYFIKTDVTLIAECDKVVTQIKANEDKVNLVFMSSGFFNFDGRDETTEGIDTKLAVHYYGRWRIASQLLPLLQNAAATDHQARVVSIMSAGREGPIVEGDLGLESEKNYSLRNIMYHLATFTSLAAARFGRLYPEIGFTHAHPGMVWTGLFRELPWYIRAIVSIPFMDKLFVPADQSGGNNFYVGYSSPDFATGAHIIDPKFKDLKPSIEAKGYLTEQLQEKVWAHTEAAFEKAKRLQSKGQDTRE